MLRMKRVGGGEYYCTLYFDIINVRGSMDNLKLHDRVDEPKSLKIPDLV